MNLTEIQALIADDMERVNELIRKRLYSEVVLINQLGHYIINGGGKRLRPLLVLLAARACGYQGREHIALAAIVEFIHTATLLHDDVVDASELRRGQETANAVWGNEASVLVGDFLYSRAFEMMVEIKSIRVMDILSHATNTIAEGEVLQLLNCHDSSTTETRYMEVIRSKTAKLFQAASQLGAVLGEKDSQLETSLAAYGMHLGTAFQLIDDVLDYRSSPAEMGKNVGDDLSEGKPTLPLIYAMHNGDDEQAEIIKQTIESGGLEQLDAVLAAIESTGAIDYTEGLARKETDYAISQLASLPGSQYKQALLALVHFSVSRAH
ncbi:MAG: octaprenyl diphosphate synthase [Gammaproteobacteria bacterium]|nr:octaprenyl diphosphate synthase [Gammaproteobacteria bacterium]